MPNKNSPSIKVNQAGNVSLLVVMIVMFVVGATVGYMFKGQLMVPGTNSSTVTYTTSQNSNTSNTGQVKVDPMFSMVTAQISGQATEINGTVVKIKDQKGMTRGFELSPDAVLASDITPEKITEANAKQKIKLNSDMIFIFKLSGDIFQISSIQPMPFVPPVEQTISHPPTTPKNK